MVTALFAWCYLVYRVRRFGIVYSKRYCIFFLLYSPLTELVFMQINYYYYYYYYYYYTTVLLLLLVQILKLMHPGIGELYS